MVKHRSRNLTYSSALQFFGASPTMNTLVGVRSALKKLYALKNIDLILNLNYLFSVLQCDYIMYVKL